MPIDDIADFFAHSQPPVNERDPVLDEAGLALLDPPPRTAVVEEPESDVSSPGRLALVGRLLARASKHT